MNKQTIGMLLLCTLGFVFQAQSTKYSHNLSSDINQIQLLDKQLLLPESFTFGHEQYETAPTVLASQQQAKEKSVNTNSPKTNPAILWQKLIRIPGVLEHQLLPGMQEIVNCVVANTHTPAQLTIVNDILDLEQQAKDTRIQILDLINRFSQIYKCDPERAQQLYTLITQKLAFLKSIKKKMNEIKSQYTS